MRILVAGGAGYIGSVLIPKLLDRGYGVDVLDRFWFGNALPDSVGIMERDLSDIRESELAEYDCAIFLAGLSNDPMAEFSPSLNFQANGAAPAYLAYSCKRAGVRRFVHGGSCSVYGYTVNELYDETSPAVSSYPYGISKLQGEFGSMQLADDDFSVIAFRQGTVSGYSPRMRLDLIVNTMFKCAIADGVIRVNNPSIWRPILAIQDAAMAYIRAIEAPEGITGVFNIASGNYTVGEVADLVRDGLQHHMGRDARLDIQHIQDFRNYKVTWKKATKVLSFKPRYNVDDIVNELVQNYDKFKDFDNPRYYNIQVFKSLMENS